MPFLKGLLTVVEGVVTAPVAVVADGLGLSILTEEEEPFTAQAAKKAARGLREMCESDEDD